jgi:DNA-directed RNA polymerase alpha subunit
MSDRQKLFFETIIFLGCSPVQPCDNCNSSSFSNEKMGEEGFNELHDEILGLLRPAENATKGQQTERAPGETTIDELNLSVRSKNCLRNEGITTIEQIADMTQMDLRRVPNLGSRSFDDVIAVLAENGWKIKGQ